MAEKFTLEKRQNKLGVAGMIVFIVLMDMFIPLSTDMYLPALPTMGEHLGTSDAMVKLSVTGFFLSYAIGMLIWGPLSDKYGRKKPLLAGYVVYTIASFLCMVSVNVYMLLLSRVLQGIGAASVTAISMAIIKDCFAGKVRETVLAIVQTFAGFAPIFAPVLGGWLLLITDWRGVFLLLTACGIIGLIFTLLYEESLDPADRLEGSIFHTFGQLGVVLKNKSFTAIVLIYSILQVPFYAYITMSSYIYVNHFGCSEQVYSYFYAASALLPIAGPYIYIRFFQNMNKRLLTYLWFGVCVVSGILTVAVGGLSPFIFCFMIFCYYFATDLLRPYSTNLILEQQSNDVGSASSVMNMSYNLFGCVGMLLAAIPFSNLVVALGIMITVCCAMCVAGWWALMRSGWAIRGFHD